MHCVPWPHPLCLMITVVFVQEREVIVMSDRSFGRFLGGAFGLSLGCLLVFGLLHWLGMPSGQLVDWVIGLAGCWWLLVVVTIPWNLHFGARQVVVAAAESRQRGIGADGTQVAYAQRWVRWSLLLALGLHLVSVAAWPLPG